MGKSQTYSNNSTKPGKKIPNGLFKTNYHESATMCAIAYLTTAPIEFRAYSASVSAVLLC